MATANALSATSSSFPIVSWRVPLRSSICPTRASVPAAPVPLLTSVPPTPSTPSTPERFRSEILRGVLLQTPLAFHQGGQQFLPLAHLLKHSAKLLAFLFQKDEHLLVFLPSRHTGDHDLFCSLPPEDLEPSSLLFTSCVHHDVLYIDIRLFSCSNSVAFTFNTSLWSR